MSRPDVPRDDTSGTDDAAVADFYSRADHDASSQPAVFAYLDGRSPFDGFAPLGGIHRMNRGVEFAVGADERVGADGDASLSRKVQFALM